MKVLIVDPDRDLVEMLKSWLKTLGYEVHRAYSGEQAGLLWEEPFRGRFFLPLLIR